MPNDSTSPRHPENNAFRPATREQRHRIGAVLLGVAGLGVLVGGIIALESSDVREGLFALMAWGLAMIVISLLFVPVELRRRSKSTGEH